MNSTLPIAMVLGLIAATASVHAQTPLPPKPVEPPLPAEPKAGVVVARVETRRVGVESRPATPRPAVIPAVPSENRRVLEPRIPLGVEPRQVALVRPVGRPAAEPGSKPRSRKGLSLQFSGSSLREVVQAIAQHSGLEVALTPGAKGTISLTLRDRSPESAIQLAAAAAGYAAEDFQGIWVVGPADEVLAAGGRVGETDLVVLQHRTFEEIAPLVPKYFPTLQITPAPGGFVVMGLSEERKRLRAFVAKLDSPVVKSVAERELVSVKSADPVAVANWLNETYPEIATQVQARTVALSGPRSSLDAAVKAVASLDTTEPQQKGVAVVALKYLNAEKAADVLRKALPSIVATAGPEPVAPPQALFNPLAGGFGASGGMGGGMGGGMAGGMGGGGMAGGGMAGAGGAGGGGFQQQVSRATRLVLVGNTDDLAIAKSIIEETDVPQPMVRIEAGLYEVAEDSIDETGLQPSTSGEISFAVPAGSSLSLPAGQVTRKAISITSTLKALVSSKKAKLLAEPNISAIDNEDANIFIGDLIRFRGSTFTPGNGGAIQGVDAIPIGIALLLRPRIHPGGEVTLKVHPVVSSATTSSADGLPQTSSREADTTVRLRPGEELVIGGLDRTERQTNVQKVPVLGDLPVVGGLFRSRNERTSKNRILVVIRAYPLTTDTAPGKQFTTPGDVR